ncbi:putative peroxidase-related enzyme [Spinactinospora alkalitolerans]|uniref:Putative peroxidase-related enzyme n=1 Tax=Spinactinospora alkalitolerans TaxID=687207 RepID=A0A852TRY5_9ACTN|nr:peroxidase-related enzyme [Spinactinospora alkalitolerans]NYE45473.1 putative peroxidase-related enzyme [Spinactinospora alkalitolerans]
MTYLRSLPHDAALPHVLRAFPDTSAPLLDYHQALLRGPSPFSVAQRELIAAYVSGLNACTYCHGVHTATAHAFGVEEGLLSELLADIDTAEVEAPMRPVLHYARKLTLTPSRITPTDAEDVYAAGWDEHALHDAVSVCALFNFMNRLVEGLGVTAGDSYFTAAATRLSGESGYAGVASATATNHGTAADTAPE